MAINVKNIAIQKQETKTVSSMKSSSFSEVMNKDIELFGKLNDKKSFQISSLSFVARPSFLPVAPSLVCLLGR